MKLISDNEFDVKNVVKQNTPVNISRLSDLDRDIASILNKNIDEQLKAKLYSQSLRRYLTFKKLRERDIIEEETKRQSAIQSALESLLKPVKQLQPSKTVKVKNKRKKPFTSRKRPILKKTLKKEPESQSESDFETPMQSPVHTPQSSPSRKRNQRLSAGKGPKPKSRGKSKANRERVNTENIEEEVTDRSVWLSYPPGPSGWDDSLELD